MIINLTPQKMWRSIRSLLFILGTTVLTMLAQAMILYSKSYILIVLLTGLAVSIPIGVPLYQYIKSTKPSQLQVKPIMKQLSVTAGMLLILYVSLMAYLGIRNGLHIGSPQVNANQQTIQQLTQHIAPWRIYMMSCVLAPISEEFVFRYTFLHTSIKSIDSSKPLFKSKTYWSLLIVQAILFGLAHMSMSSWMVVLNTITPYLLIGLTCGLTYTITKNLTYSVLLHSIYNAIALFILFSH